MLFRSRDGEHSWVVSGGRFLPATAGAWTVPTAQCVFVVTRPPHRPGWGDQVSGVFLTWTDALQALLRDLVEQEWLETGSHQVLEEMFDFELPTSMDELETFLDERRFAAEDPVLWGAWENHITIGRGRETHKISHIAFNQERTNWWRRR